MLGDIFIIHTNRLCTRLYAVDRYSAVCAAFLINEHGQTIKLIYLYHQRASETCGRQPAVAEAQKKMDRWLAQTKMTSAGQS